MGIDHPGMKKIIELLESGGDLAIAGIGDSLTFGWMVSQGYFDCFCDVLQRRYPAGIIKRVNAGVPGDTARGGLRRLGGVLQGDPDLVVVQFGLNDMATGAEVEEFEDDLDTLACRVTGSGALPLLVTSCPVLGEQGVRVEAYYDAVRRVAKARQAPLADIAHCWREKRRHTQGAGPWHLSDGVHPSDEGHRVMAECLLTLFSRDTFLSPPPF